LENFMKRLSTVIFPGIAVVALAALFLRGWVGATAATVAQSTRGSMTCGVWHTVASPNVGTSTNFLNGVTTISAKNVWAVGTEGNGNGGLTLVEHWTGTKWKVVASPVVNGSSSDSLSGVAAVAANNIWAVGKYFDASNNQQTLIEHWNGSSWSVVHSPSGGQLYGVAALAANNVWAVGSFSGASTNGYQTLIEHWNGSNWSVVSSPSPGLATNTLNGVAAFSANNIWAVGDESSSVGPSAPFAPLVEHWNGSGWSVVTSPLQGTSDLLNGIAVISASNIWAVGDYRSSIDPQGPYFTLIEHWNGTSWKVAKSPSPGSVASVLEAAARVPSTTSVWGSRIHTG
jgi:hypothetical protein